MIEVSLIPLVLVGEYRRNPVVTDHLVVSNVLTDQLIDDLATLRPFSPYRFNQNGTERPLIEILALHRAKLADDSFTEEQRVATRLAHFRDQGFLK